MLLGAGSDTYDGRGGVVLQGLVNAGEAADTYVLSDARTTVIDSGTMGRDTLFVSADYALAAASGIDLIQMTGLARTFVGDDGVNEVIGTGLANLLSGMGGVDTLRGQGGDDDLRGGADGDSLFGGDDQDTIWGDAGNDRVLGDAGDDLLRGGAGLDTLTGGLGADTLRGGSGANVFDFNDLAEIEVSDADRIADFLRGTDRIDLSGIDARPGVAGDQLFAFVGAAAFTGVGQLRVVIVGGDVVVQVNTVAGVAAEAALVVAGVGTLGGGDFIL